MFCDSNIMWLLFLVVGVPVVCDRSISRLMLLALVDWRLLVATYLLENFAFSHTRSGFPLFLPII